MDERKTRDEVVLDYSDQILDLIDTIETCAKAGDEMDKDDTRRLAWDIALNLYVEALEAALSTKQ